MIDVNVRVIECGSDMARVALTGRPCGHIRQRGRSFQVIVYAGIDPVTGKPHRLSASTTNEKEAERILRRLIHEVEQQIHARTNATLSEALDAWLRVHAAEANTLAGYEANARRYIKPVMGHLAIGKITTQMLEEFYAQLRRCRTRCNGRPFVEHRVDGAHDCRVVKHRRGPGRPPAEGYPSHNCDAFGCQVTECAPHASRSRASPPTDVAAAQSSPGSGWAGGLVGAVIAGTSLQHRNGHRRGVGRRRASGPPVRRRRARPASAGPARLGARPARRPRRGRG